MEARPELCSWKEDFNLFIHCILLSHSCQQLLCCLEFWRTACAPNICLHFSNYVICSKKKKKKWCCHMSIDHCNHNCLSRKEFSHMGFLFLNWPHSTPPPFPSPFPSFRLVIHICSLLRSLRIWQVQQRCVLETFLYTSVCFWNLISPTNNILME